MLDSKRYNLNPTLTLTNKSDTTFTIQGFVSRQQQQAYQGLPVYGTLFGDLKLNRDMFIGPADIPQSYSTSKGVTFTFDHQFDAVWSANVKAQVESVRVRSVLAIHFWIGLLRRVPAGTIPALLGTEQLDSPEYRAVPAAEGVHDQSELAGKVHARSDPQHAS